MWPSWCTHQLKIDQYDAPNNIRFTFVSIKVYKYRRAISSDEKIRVIFGKPFFFSFEEVKSTRVHHKAGKVLK